jgi:hypothetical protein
VAGIRHLHRHVKIHGYGIRHFHRHVEIHGINFLIWSGGKEQILYWTLNINIKETECIKLLKIYYHFYSLNTNFVFIEGQAPSSALVYFEHCFAFVLINNILTTFRSIYVTVKETQTNWSLDRFVEHPCNYIKIAKRKEQFDLHRMRHAFYIFTSQNRYKKYLISLTNGLSVRNDNKWS